LWDVAQGTELRVLQGHSFRIGEVTFSPDGKLLASGDGYVWSPTSPLHPSTSGKTAHEPMQRQAQIETSTPFTVILWDAASGTERRRWEVETPIHTVAFSPRGDRLAAGGGWPDGRARVGADRGRRHGRAQDRRTDGCQQPLADDRRIGRPRCGCVLLVRRFPGCFAGAGPTVTMSANPDVRREGLAVLTAGPPVL
jgi:WD40 repeat protein